MEEVSFSFEGNTESFKCKGNDKMKGLTNQFPREKNLNEKSINNIYKGKEINKESTINEHINEEDKNNSHQILSKEIICPECKENTLLGIKDFKIILQRCKNGHKINDILLHKFEESQKIDSSKIICQICKKTNKYESHNHEFYICCNCSKNLCPSCKSNHDKAHIIINYEDKNYICKKHNESYIQYCEKCEENLCFICEKEHDNHDIYYLGEIFISKDELEKSIKNLKIVIDKFKFKVKVMKEVLDKMANILDIYYKINNDIARNYNINKRNYIKLINLNCLKDNNNKIIKDLTNAINSDKIYEYSIAQFYNDYGQKYIGEIKNGIKEGKGVLYFNKKDNREFKRYEGEFKDDTFNGNGLFFRNNDSIYIPKFQDGINEKKKIDINNTNDNNEKRKIDTDNINMKDKNIKNEYEKENKCNGCFNYFLAFCLIIIIISALDQSK